MEGIEHKTVKVNGINMHVAEKGQGPLILFIHGFPELWYSWRHQIHALASLGYRAVAPDLRGYGGTDAPPSVTDYSCLHHAGDLVALLDVIAPEEDKVYVVGHDWGALIASYLCMFRPDRVKALVNLSVAYLPRNPKMKPLQTLKAAYGDDFYMCRFQEPGEIEAEFAEIGTKQVLKGIFTIGPEPLALPKGKYFRDPVLPSWLSEEDLNYYASNFDKTGFTAPINYYRCLDLNWELTAPWHGTSVKVPTKFIVGDLDLTYNFQKHIIHSDEFKKVVPNLVEVVVMEGVGHFINQVRPEDINKHICDFINKF